MPDPDVIETVDYQGNPIRIPRSLATINGVQESSPLALPDIGEADAAALAGFARPGSAPLPARPDPSAQLGQPVQQPQAAVTDSPFALPGSAPSSDPMQNAEAWRAPVQQPAAAPQAAPQPAQQASGPDYANIAQRAAQGDPQAVATLVLAHRQGDAQATAALGDLDALQAAGVLQPQRTGGGGPRVTQTSTTTMQQAGRAATPEEQARLDEAGALADDADGRYIDGITRQAEAEARSMREGAERMQQANIDMRAMEQEQEVQRRAQQAEIDRRTGELDRTIREVGDRRVEANTLFGKANTRNRVGASIALAMAGLGDAFAGNTRGTDQVMAGINRAIDSDLNEQQTNLSAAQSNLGARRGMLADMRAKFGTDEAAREAAKAAMLEDSIRQVRALERHAQGEGRQSQLQQLLAQLDAQKAQSMQAAVMAGLGTTEIVREERARSGGGGARRPAINYGAALGEAPEVDSAERARLAEQEVTAREGLTTIDEALAALDNTMFAGRIMGDGWALSEGAQNLDRLLTQAAMPAVQEAFGAANPEQVEMMQNTMGFSRNISEEQLRENLTRERRRLEQRLAAGQLSVSTDAVQESQTRAPSVRQSVRMNDGRTEDAVPGFVPEAVEQRRR